MAPIDLSTTYLGLRLANPFMAGASPLGGQLDTARRLEDAGCAAIVLHSLFEEQITEHATGRIHQMDRLQPSFAAILAPFPKPDAYPFGPDEYLEHIQQVKRAVRVPVIASLNGTSPEAWLTFAARMAQAGADAIELNMYEIVTDLECTSAAVERTIVNVVADLRRALPIPLAVKLSPFFTAFGSVARSLESAGANGVVLFNRFLQPDIDVHHMAVWPRLELSSSRELLLRLRWAAILSGRVRCSIAISGGVATPADGIKAILAGADVVQLVSAILRHGPSYFAAMRDELRRWMETFEFARVGDVRGRLSLAKSESPS